MSDKKLTYECCYGKGQPILKRCDLTELNDHPDCRGGSIIKETNLQPYFGFPEIQARISYVPRNILAKLSFCPNRLKQALVELQTLQKLFKSQYKSKYDYLLSNLHSERIDSDMLRNMQSLIAMVRTVSCSDSPVVA